MEFCGELMQIKLNVEKKYFFGILAAVMIAALGIGVYAYGTNNPGYFGHSAGEVDWSGVVPQICFSDGCVANRASLIGATGATGPQGIQGPVGNNRLSWDDNLARISIDNGVNNAAVSYADRAGVAGSAGSISSSSGCYVCVREGKSGCPNPSQVTAWTCASLAGGQVSGWTNDDNGHCTQIKIDCDGDLQN